MQGGSPEQIIPSDGARARLAFPWGSVSQARLGGDVALSWVPLPI